MAFLTQLATNTLSNQNIATALNVLTYTNTSRIRKVYVTVACDQIAGNGSYTCYATVQRAGAGSAYQTTPITTATVASGITAIIFESIALTLNATDVLKIYVLGLAGDTTTPDIIVDVNEEFILTDASGNVTFSNTSIATVTTLTNAPPNSAGVTTILADYARRTGDYATVGALMGLADSAITSSKFSAGAIDNAAIATDAIGAAELAASAVAEIQAGLSTLTQAQILNDATPFAGANIALIKTDTTNLINRLGAFTGAGVNTVLGFLRAIANKAVGVATPSDLSSGGTFTNTTDALEAIADSASTPPTPAAIADAVWDEQIAGHLTVGSTGAALNNLVPGAPIEQTIEIGQTNVNIGS